MGQVRLLCDLLGNISLARNSKGWTMAGSKDSKEVIRVFFLHIALSLLSSLLVLFFWKLRAYIVHTTLIPKENPIVFYPQRDSDSLAQSRTWALGHGRVSCYVGRWVGMEGRCLLCPWAPFPQCRCLIDLWFRNPHVLCHGLLSWITPWPCMSMDLLTPRVVYLCN